MEVSRLVHQIAEDVYYVEQDRFIFEDPSLSGFNVPVASPISGSEISLGSPKASNDKDIPTNFALKSDDEEIEIKVDHSVNVEGLQVSISPQKQEIVTTPTTPIFEFEFPEVTGRFQVLEKIGEGTFSSVYKAISHTNGQVVAIKRINPTCSPDRILNEIKHLHLLGGKGHVAPLLGALRSGDQVSLILPYVEHERFKDYLPHMNLHQIKDYMRSLFQALEHLHAHKIIHRDLKPGNFLYNPKTETYVLVDFGLAQNQIDVPPEPILINEKLIGSPLKRRRNESTYEQQSLQAVNKRIKCPTISSRVNSPVTVHRIRNISQKSLRAPRGGTRGFRAPEVLMKCLNQTVAIDVWSAGVILLCVLSTRYPFFNAPDDLVSLAELSALFGTREVRDVAILLNRRVHFPVEITKPSLKQVCNALSCRKEVMPDSAFHLLARCLDINPNTRITASEALRHPFLNEA